MNNAAQNTGSGSSTPRRKNTLSEYGIGKRRVLLFVFTCINLLNYFDRGAVSVCLSTITEVYSLSHFEGGLLAGAYMVGYIASAPLFAFAVTHYSAFRLMSIGLLIWCGATMLCAFSIGFKTLLLARAITGVGEASFLSIAPPFIDRIAPPNAKSTWMGTCIYVIRRYSMMPVTVCECVYVVCIHTLTCMLCACVCHV